MKTGLIMEGGAMRGMFTCGVIDVMQEAGITFDGAIGVSAGAETKRKRNSIRSKILLERPMNKGR